MTKRIYDTATNVQGLPKAFREVADRLPIVTNILDSVKDGINKKDASCKGVKPIVEACEKKAKTLNDIFRRSIPQDGAGNIERYWRAVKTIGKETR